MSLNALTIIGGGNVGSALAHLFIEKKVLLASELSIIEPDTKKASDLKKSLKVSVYSEIQSFLSKSDVVILAVKPKNAMEVCEQCASFLSKNTLIISVMAGVTLSALKEMLGGHKILIRSMPNLAAQVGKSMTVYVSSTETNAAQCKKAETLFASIGKSLRVSNEKLVDAATAISGNGPAYLYYFMELLIGGAEALGFSKEEAELLTGQTVEGGLFLWQKTQLSPETLRRQIMTEGGTTAAAIEVFDKNELPKIFTEGVRRGFERSVELGKPPKR